MKKIIITLCLLCLTAHSAQFERIAWYKNETLSVSLTKLSTKNTEKFVIQLNWNELPGDKVYVIEGSYDLETWYLLHATIKHTSYSITVDDLEKTMFFRIREYHPAPLE